ncbi:3251_t:CDS:1, partial [Scutellospora calospora]
MACRCTTIITSIIKTTTTFRTRTAHTTSYITRTLSVSPAYSTTAPEYGNSAVIGTSITVGVIVGTICI